MGKRRLTREEIEEICNSEWGDPFGYDSPVMHWRHHPVWLLVAGAFAVVTGCITAAMVALRR